VPCRAGVSDPLLAVAAGAPAAAEKGKPKKVSAAVRAMQEAQEARARAEEEARQAEEERRRKVRAKPALHPRDAARCMCQSYWHMCRNTLYCHRVMNLLWRVPRNSLTHHAAFLWRCVV
jgi:hypothetical protein